MIVFLFICVLLIVVALAFILPPLRRPDRIAAGRTTTEANVAVYRGQLGELETDLGQQIITKEQFLQDREELERRLIADLPDDVRAVPKQKLTAGPGRLTPALAVGVPLSAILLYLLLGAPSLLQ
jgi:cytochrome c-type biogenesis protein CcmH